MRPATAAARRATSSPHISGNARRAAGSARKARYRARLRDGVIVVGVPVTNEVIGLLLDTNYLALAESEDRGAIAVAIGEMLRDASQHGAANDR